MRHLKKIRDTNGSHGTVLVSQIFFKFSSMIVNTSICKKGKVKDETSKKFVKPMEIKLWSKMSHWPKIPHRNVWNPNFDVEGQAELLVPEENSV